MSRKTMSRKTMSSKSNCVTDSPGQADSTGGNAAPAEGISCGRFNRRRFVQVGTAAAALPLILSNPASAFSYRANERPRLACIGTGSRWGGVGPAAMEFADCVAVCDVDTRHREGAANRVAQAQNHQPDQYEDYRQLLEAGGFDVVTIVTPDHWHTKIAIEAMQAGCDVYCEKPLTLTIKEGQQICEVVKETGAIFQVGTQQRSEMGQRFLQAIGLIRDGRIGDVQKVHVAIGGSPTSPALPVVDVPDGLNWDFWLGQAPLVDYRAKDRNSRCHYEFRWWYEYSGGKMTDWGAHHVDIAQWGLDQVGEGQGPQSIECLEGEHPVPMENGYPTKDDRYNTATQFRVRVMFDNDVEMQIRHNCQDLGFGNGILFEGTQGRFLVNRGKIVGEPIEELKDHPLPEGLLQRIYKGREIGQPNAHMRNFFDSVKDRNEPISDVFSHHRALTTCHLANISLRLNRKLLWDPQGQEIIADDEANQWLAREQREGFEINV